VPSCDFVAAVASDLATRRPAPGGIDLAEERGVIDLGLAWPGGDFIPIA
jgi:hypothetical protein